MFFKISADLFPARVPTVVAELPKEIATCTKIAAMTIASTIYTTSSALVLPLLSNNRIFNAS